MNECGNRNVLYYICPPSLEFTEDFLDNAPHIKNIQTQEQNRYLLNMCLKAVCRVYIYLTER